MNIFKNILNKTVGLKAYEVKDEVIQILNHLMNDKNFSKVKDLIDCIKKENGQNWLIKHVKMVEADKDL